MNVKLIMDLGNSESRVMLIGSKGLMKPINEFFRLENTYSMVTKSIDLKPYAATESMIFEVNDNGQHFKVATGLLGEEFVTKLRPTGLGQKYQAPTTSLGLVRVLIEAVRRIAKHEDLPASEVLANVNFDLMLLMPPQEVNGAQKHFEHHYKDGIAVNQTFPEELNGVAKVASVKVLNEGLMGYLAVSLDYATLKPRELNNDIRVSKVLLLDIGAGTTELMIVNKNTMIENSRTTIRMGCINIINKIKDLATAQFGFPVTFEAAEEAQKTGYLPVGRQGYDVIELVNSARQDVAMSLVESINSYLSSILMPLSTIEDLLIFGGGVINKEGSGLTSVANYVKEPLSASAKGAEFVDYTQYLGKEVCPEVAGDELLFNERTMNIIGAGIIAKLLEKKQG